MEYALTPVIVERKDVRYSAMRILLLFLVLVTVVHAELRVDTNFEGGNAEVVSLDQATRTLRFMPAVHEGRGWPCWWYLKVEGLTVGEAFTLQVQAQTKPYREKLVLARAWCQPKHAWISTDNATFKPGAAAGTLTEDKAMSYVIKAEASQMWFAWGPPFLPSTAEKLLAEIAAKLPGSKRFELAKTRDGRSVNGIRIGNDDAPDQVWVNARHHAWEAGGSWVGNGFIRWFAGDEPEAVALRQSTCLHFVPIIDVDNVAIGSGGKDAVPRDHNRDWADQPLYPEVAAAQRLIADIEKKHGLDVYIDLHNPGAEDPIFFFGPFNFERMTGVQQQNYKQWIDLAAANITMPLHVLDKYRYATYVTTEEERGRMSSGWVRGHTSDASISVTLETGWNSKLMSVAGYGQVGAGLGKTLAEYLKAQRQTH